MNRLILVEMKSSHRRTISSSCRRWNLVFGFVHLLAYLMIQETMGQTAVDSSTGGTEYANRHPFQYYLVAYWVFAVLSACGLALLVWLLPIRLFRTLVVYVFRFPAIHKKNTTDTHHQHQTIDSVHELAPAYRMRKAKSISSAAPVVATNATKPATSNSTSDNKDADSVRIDVPSTAATDDTQTAASIESSPSSVTIHPTMLSVQDDEPVTRSPQVSVVKILDPHLVDSDENMDGLDGTEETIDGPSSKKRKGYQPMLICVFGVPVDLALRYDWFSSPKSNMARMRRESPLYADSWWMSVWVYHLLCFTLIIVWMAFFSLAILTIHIHELHVGDMCPAYIRNDEESGESNWDCYHILGWLAPGAPVNCVTLVVNASDYLLLNDYYNLQCWRWVNPSSEQIVTTFSLCAALLTLVLGGLISVLSQILIRVYNLRLLRFVSVFLFATAFPLMVVTHLSANSLLSIYLPSFIFMITGYTVLLRLNAQLLKQKHAEARQKEAEEQQLQASPIVTDASAMAATTSGTGVELHARSSTSVRKSATGPTPSATTTAAGATNVTPTSEDDSDDEGEGEEWGKAHL